MQKINYFGLTLETGEAKWQQRGEKKLDRLESAAVRLFAAVAALEEAMERRAQSDAARANIDEELALLQDDRSRLAIELDGSLARSRRQDLVQQEITQRLEHSRQTIAKALDCIEAEAILEEGE